MSPRWAALLGRQPGKVRLSSKALIALQREALRATDLEVEVAGLRAEAASMVRRRRALELVGQLAPTAEVAPHHPRVQALLDDLPQGPGGVLHEEAFLALLDRRLWDCRLEAAGSTPDRTTDH